MLSLFQLLPDHIARKIVDHLLGCSRLTFDGLDADDEYRPLLIMPLLSLCQVFRKIVYFEYSKNYKICIVTPYVGGSIFTSAWPSTQCGSKYPTRHLAKTLHFVVAIDLIYSGVAIRELRQPLLFPRVRTIDISLVWPDMESDIRYPSETVANIRTFAKRIKEIAPSVNKISMGPARIPDDVPQSAGLHFSTLVSQLFGITNRVSYDSQLAIMPMSLQPDGIRDLVYLSYVTENDDPNISHLGVVTVARQSARTLQHLDISVPQYMDMSELVKNNAVYPCLTQLLLASLPPLPRRVIYANQPKVMLSLPTRTHAPLPSVAHGVVLFPSLQSLKITNSYPFADDAPFRGNSRELRKLHLLIDRDVCGILRQYGVFTPTSHPKLHCVKVDMPYDIMPSHFASYDEYVQFALGLGPNAAVRAFEDIHSCLAAPTLSLLQGHDCIQMLALYETRLALADICRIVEWLPLLSDLHCRSIRLGALPCMTFGKFAKYMCSQHISKRQRFRCLRLGYDDGDSIMEIVRCVMGLALAFPAFDYAAVPNYVTAEFMKAIKSTIALKECKQYAPRLKRLLFTKTG